MAAKTTGSAGAGPGAGRGRRKPRLIDRIVDFPYRRLFGLKGCAVLAAVVLVVLGVRFVTGIATVTLDPMTCELAWTDAPYRLFHEQQILANTRRELPRLLAEKQTALWAIRAGRDPFASKADGNVARIKRIDKDKFFWRSYAENLEKQRAAIGECLHRLPAYRFD